MMRAARLTSVVLLTVTLSACAAKAQVRTEAEMPPLDPPPPPPRVVAIYEAEPSHCRWHRSLSAVPVRPPARPRRPGAEARAVTERREPVEAAAAKPRGAVSHADAVAWVRSADGSRRFAICWQGRARPVPRECGGAQWRWPRPIDQARRFMQQADEALKTRNIVFAGKLADKAATMAAVLVR